MRRFIGYARAAAVAALAAIAAAAAADESLDRHRAVWSEAGPTRYVYAYQKYCDCHREEPPQTFVEVAGGEVVDVYHLHADSERRVPAREGSLDLYWTIPGLFGLIEAAEAQGAAYRADYDAAVGYPLRVYVDYDAAMVGEEIDIRLTLFQARD